MWLVITRDKEREEERERERGQRDEGLSTCASVDVVAHHVQQHPALHSGSLGLPERGGTMM